MKSARVVLILSAILMLVVAAAVSTPDARATIGVCDQGNLVDVESTGGPSTVAGYATLGAAFAAINVGTHTGTVDIEICGDTAEGAATALLNASGSGSASYASISIKPVGGAARTVIGATTAGNPLIDLNGADNVTIDGVNAAGNSLTISNTTASAISGTSTIRFINGATSDTVTNASVLGSFSGANSVFGGNIYIATDSSTANGNDNLSVTNCSIGPAGTNLPTVGICGNGTTTDAVIGNNNILIDNNRIFDFFGAGVNSSGVYVGGGNSAWTITNNRFYQTAARTWTTTLRTNRPIEVNNSTDVTGAQGMTLIGNIIGSSSPSGTGTYALSGSSGRFMGIYFSGLGGAAVSTISNNTVASVSVTGVTSSGACSSTALGGIIIGNGSVQSNNNTIGSQSATGSLVLSTTATAATEVCGMYNIGNYSWVANGNTIGGISGTNAGAGIFIIYGMRAQTLSSATFDASSNIIGGTVANSIQNNSTTPATAQVIGLASTGTTSGPSFNCTSNTIRNLTSAGGTGTGTTASVIGISVNATAAAHVIQQNTVYGLSNSSASAAVWVTGINFSGSTSLPSLVARNLIHTLKTASSSATATINGINVVGGLATYQNNMISLGNGLTSGAQINGINETVAGTDNFYFNSVYIGGSGVSGSANTFAFQSSITNNTRNYLNNIFYNARSNGAGTGKHYAVRVGGSAPSPAGLTSNSNVLYATGTGGNVGLFNGADAPTLVSWQAATGQDGASFFSDPQYIDPTGATAVNLHIATGPVTVVEGNGVAIGGVTDDFDGELRAGYTPTDIGADAGNFTGLDLAGPAIAYTPPRHTSITTDRTLPITVTDASGVPTSGIGLPVLYFRKGTSGAYASNQCAFVSGGSYDCVFTYASVGGVTAGDVIQYFVAAQDAPGNVSLNPMGGAAGLTPNPPAAATPPTIPGTFNISAPINGAKTLCPSGCDYDSLTNALGLFDRINNGALTGNTTVTILGDLTAETGAFALGAWAEDGAGGYTLTIGPGGAPRLISGSVVAPMIKLNGADRVTFDGSLSGGTDRSLTVTNTYAGSAGSVFWIASASTTDGATNNTIKNCIIFGDTGSTTGAAIIAGSGTTPGGAADSPNSNNTIRNNRISRAQNAVFASGNAVGLDQNWVIADNTIGSPVAAEKMGFRGIFVGNAQNLTITGNTINGVILASTSTAAGIQIGSTINGGTISGNQVGDIKNTNTGGWRAYGIYLAASSAASNLTVANNVVYDIAGYGDTSLVEYNGHGIVLYAGGGYRVYHNSVRLTTDQANGGIPAAIFITGTITAAGSLDIRDNSFATAQTIGTRYAIYSVATSAVFSDIDFNDYWPGTGTLGYLGSARATLAAWQGATGRDANSLSADPLYNSPTDLRPQPGSPLLAAGTPVGIATDFLGAPRSLSAPAIGAYEYPVDSAGPTISYAAVPSTTSTLDRTFTVSATDSSGVPTSGAGLPTVYYRKGASGPYSSNQCLFVGGSDYSCTIAYAPVGGVAVGDMVQWYVAAQDSLASPNVSVSPFAGAGGYTANPPGVTTPPDPPNSYMITLGYAGSYTAGSGGTFLSLTNPGGLFETINAGVLTGSITVDVTSDMTAETGAVALNQWIEEGPGGYTLTIRPSGAPRVISGSGGGALIELNGADRVVFDGSLSGGTDRSLTIASTGTAQSVFWIGSASTSNGAMNNTIRNCVIAGLDTLTTVGGIVAGSGTSLGADAEAPNSNNTVQNNRIISVQNGLYLRGLAGNLDQNWLITGNTLGSTNRLEKLSYRGMFVGNSQNVTVSNNTITGVVSAATSTNTMTGVQFGFTISGGTITGNTISDIKQTNTLGYGCNGIYLQQTSTAANVTVANNVIYDVAGYGRSGVLATNNGYGISIVSGGGYRLYHNSVTHDDGPGLDEQHHRGHQHHERRLDRGVAGPA